MTELHLPTEIELPAFISKEAHDLKSPFNRALGFIKLVMKGMDGPISDQAKEDLTVSYQNIQYALVLMNGLIQAARLSRGEREVSLVDCPVESTLQQMIVEWKRQYPKEKPVEINLTTPAVGVEADDAALRQCLSNWISYVAEFAPENGVVDIKVEEQPETCLFTLRSTGTRPAPPPECELTLYGYVALRLLELNGGVLRRAEEDESGALVQFTLPKT